VLWEVVLDAASISDRVWALRVVELDIQVAPNVRVVGVHRQPIGHLSLQRFWDGEQALELPDIDPRFGSGTRRLTTPTAKASGILSDKS